MNYDFSFQRLLLTEDLENLSLTSPHGAIHVGCYNDSRDDSMHLPSCSLVECRRWI